MGWSLGRQPSTSTLDASPGSRRPGDIANPNREHHDDCNALWLEGLGEVPRERLRGRAVSLVVNQDGLVMGPDGMVVVGLRVIGVGEKEHVTGVKELLGYFLELWFVCFQEIVESSFEVLVL